jgi:hypothetical protein
VPLGREDRGVRGAGGWGALGGLAFNQPILARS